MRPFVTFLLLLFLCLPQWALAEQVAGYGRDGSRVYPDVTPPTTWSASDIKWETPLPSWGHGSPIVVGDKLIVLCEPTPQNYFPLLICMDANSGAILWQQEVDHLAATGLDSAQQETVRQKWKTYLDDFFKRQELHAQWREASDKAAFEATLKEQGYEYNKRWNTIRKTGKDKTLRELNELAGFACDGWLHNGLGDGLGVIGQAYATPCSDGEFIYVATAFSAVGCYDLDGKLKWMGYANGASGEFCRAGRSPIIHKDLVISDIMNHVRAFDRATGKLLWEDRLEKAHTVVTPAVLTIGDADVLIAAGANAYLLPSGKKLTMNGWVDEGMQVLVKHDERDVAFFCGSGEHCGWTKKGAQAPNPPAAVRFSLSGDTLNAEVLWHGGSIAEAAGVDVKNVKGGNAPWMVYDDGKFYHSAGAILDALTGKVIAGELRGKTKAVPSSSHIRAIANGHIYGFTGRGSKKGPIKREGTCQVYTVDGKMVASNPVIRKEVTPEQKKMLRACATYDEVSGFSYGQTFTFGGSNIYFRSFTSIVCVGK